MYMPQIQKECGGVAHKATATSCRAISDQNCYFYTSKTNLIRDQKWPRAHPWHLTKLPLSQHRAPGCHNLYASLGHLHFDVSIQMSVWKLCAVQTETKKKQGRKISLANFQLLYDSNSFLSPAAQCYRPDLCPGSREHLDHIPHVCLLIALCSDFPAYLEASYSTFNTFKLNLA